MGSEEEEVDALERIGFRGEVDLRLGVIVQTNARKRERERQSEKHQQDKKKKIYIYIYMYNKIYSNINS